jgi:exodeoxyribonuclease V alpha subunit
MGHDPPDRLQSDIPGIADEPKRGEVIEGVLDRIVYANEETAWSVVKIDLPGRRDLITAVGNLLGVQPGESLRLRGEWVQDKKYGSQFRVDSYLTIQPATLLGIEKYLGSGLVRGIGKVMAGRLVKSFGLDTLDVIENQPKRLTEVEGIGPVRSGRIRQAWAEQRGIKEVMLFLQSHGVTTSHAIRIYREYRERAVAIVRENPYRLALDVFGIGFKTADQIARNLGVEPTSPRRAEAGVLHLLGEFSGEGHVFYPHDLLVQSAEKILSIDRGIIERAIVTLALTGHAVIETLTGESEKIVFLTSLHSAETEVASLLIRLSGTPAKPVSIDVERAIGWFEEHRRITLAPLQREAVRHGLREKFLVITGGPGTGKTTLVNGIIRILERKGRRILLTAPTGRAAKRLQETTGREAKTIHRLLEFSPKQLSFQRNQSHPLAADLLVVDEFSMVDIVLAQNLLKAVPPACQVIVVGDIDQLPSVGPGSMLADLIRSGVFRVVRLNQIFRQAERSRIVVNAHRVNRGEMPLAEDAASGTDFFFIPREDPEEILASLKFLVGERIPQRFALDPVDGVQVLTPMHKGLLGATNLNAELQQLLNPSGESIARGSRIFRVGDKVLQIRNNYDLDVHNGDIGRIVRCDAIDQKVRVRYEDRTVTYDYADLDEIVLAYACSIHKAQGSEYPCVVIPLHTQHYMMLQRNLLYTGITRGRRLVVLVGSRRALALAVKNNRLQERNTRLAERLREIAGPA